MAAYDDAPPSFADLAPQLAAGNFATTPQAAPQAVPSASSTSGASDFTPDEQAFLAQSGVPSGTTVWRSGQTGQLVGYQGDDGLNVFTAAPAAPPSWAPAKDQSPIGATFSGSNGPSATQGTPPGPLGGSPATILGQNPQTASSDSTAPFSGNDDISALLSGGYSLSPGGPIVGATAATAGPTSGQLAAQQAVAAMNTMPSSGLPFQDLAHTATLGLSDVLPSGIFAVGTGVKNALMRATGQTPPFSAGDAYQAQRQQLADAEAQFRSDHPRADLGLTVGGALMTPAPAAGFVLKGLPEVASLASRLPQIGDAAANLLAGTSLAGRVARAAPVGAVMGAVAGAADTTQGNQFKGNVASGATLGGLGAPAFETLGVLANPVLRRIVAGALPQKVTSQVQAAASAALRDMRIDQLPQAANDQLQRLLSRGYDPVQAARTAAAGSLPHPVRLSRGQMGDDLGQQWSETQMKNGLRGPGAASVVRGFQGDQQQALRQNAETIGRQLAGGRTVQPGTGGAGVSDALNEARNAAHASMKGAYAKAEEAPGQAVMHAYDGDALTGSVVKAVDNFDPRRIPHVAREIERLGELTKSREGADVRELFRLRSRLTALRASNDGVEASAAAAAVKAFDAQLEQAVSDGLFSGDPKTVDLWRNAIGERREFGHLFQGGDLIEKLTAREPRSGRLQLAVDPHDASNVILGRSALGFIGRRNLYRDLNVLKTRLGANSAGWNGIRGEVFQRLASASAKTVEGQPALDGVKFDQLWSSFKQEDPQLVSSLFTPEESAIVDRFAAVAARATRNPSGASMGGFSVRQMLKRLPFAGIESLPLIGHMADKIDAMAGQGAAMRATVRSAPGMATDGSRAPSFAAAGAAAAQRLRQRGIGE